MKNYWARASFHLKRELSYLDIRHRPKRILFDHLPKCAGLTLNAYLEWHYPRRKVFSTNPKKASSAEYRVDYDVLIEKFRSLPEKKRHQYDLVTGHFSNELIGFVHPQCLKVTVLRDPVERIISHYFFVKSLPEHYLHSIVENNAMSLEDYATSRLSDELQNWYVTHFSGLSLQEAEARPDAAVEKAVDYVVEQYDLVGFLDDFSTFVQRLRQAANLRNDYQERERVNVTKNKPDSKTIAESTLAIIRQENHLDVAFYQAVRERLS